ncbi:unnamed protein product [Rotaria sordida]|uniref:Uncharacterized protein n=2 Tax=Rotaria sordida TaxID=392033 RepID=A0A815DXI8_9BILA|nr:unnamed protein product [Rotaria sordida]CAF1303507.1 unnamed protein product [Rotaria sordida]
MKAALALIFFACVAGSMASNVHNQFIGQLVQEGQVMAQTVFTYLQQQIHGFVQHAFGELSSLVASIGRFDIQVILNQIVDQFKPLLAGLANQALSQVLGSLSGVFGGRGSVDLGAIFSGFLSEISGAVQGLGQHFLNQGLAAVLGGLGSFGGRGLNDLLAGLQAQIGSAVSAAQGILQGVVGNITTLGSTLLDASKPHWEQLQEQLVGHGLNVLGSLSETINNLHGSITGGR